MNTFTKALLAGSMLATAGLAQAATVSISYDPNAEQDFINSLRSGYVTENFDNLGIQGTGPQYYGTQDDIDAGDEKAQKLSWEDSNPSFETNVGTFTLLKNGLEPRSWLPESDGDNLKIESARTGEFGREALSNYEGDFWLDSNDALEVTWDFNSGAVVGKEFNAFGFYVADAADVKAQLTLTFQDGDGFFSDSYTIPQGQNNAEVGYVTVKSAYNIVGGTLTFDNSARNDGWGIDDVTVGRLPEPGTLLLMGLGLLGLGAARRRTAK